MNQQVQEERTIISLRMEVEPYPQDARPVRFTVVDGAGDALSADVPARTGALENLHDVLAGISSQTTPATGELVFGEIEGTRVILGFDGDTGPPYRFHITFAFPASGETYQPVTWTAPVSAASLIRFVDGLHAVTDAGLGTVDWTVAD